MLRKVIHYYEGSEMWHTYLPPPLSTEYRMLNVGFLPDNDKDQKQLLQGLKFKSFPSTRVIIYSDLLSSYIFLHRLL